SLGVFYVFPILVAATVLNRWQILIAALVCALIRGAFAPGGFTAAYWVHFELAMLAYGGIGLLTVEMSRNRRVLLAAYARLKLEKEMRHRAEGQFRVLAESSPAAIITINRHAEVLAANHSAHELLGFAEPNSLLGKNLAEYIPLFSDALQISPGARPIRTHASTWAKRSNGVMFPVAAWFSTAGEGENRCLAGIVVDMSEEVRERERENFQHFLAYNRLVAGAVSHEIRNMCSAIRVVFTNLRRRPALAEDTDFLTLATLVDSLGSIASFELRNGKDKASRWENLNSVLEQLRVVIEPDWTDIDGVIHWELEYPAPEVCVDSYALLQVFLNLAQNSLRAAQQRPNPQLEIQARTVNSTTVVSFIDSGPGIEDATRLFQPFREDADNSGLGLYVSRTLVRSFGGELTFVPTIAGCRFDVTLPAAAPAE
ncbi:MAG: ATP-binding protein, partial [Candidatus Korobacteraceae bacterium]